MLEKLKETFRGRFYERYPMSRYTTFKTGGEADYMIFPENEEELVLAIEEIKKENIPYIILGNGSNIIVRDGGIEGAVISTNKIRGITNEGNTIYAYAGSLMREVAAYALRLELTGLEFASGIPGTIGGGVYMNAGAYGPELKDVIERVWYLDDEGILQNVENRECAFDYRKSFFSDHRYTIVKCSIALEKGDREKIKARMDELNKRRRDKQPLNYPSAGSTFRRPEGYFAGKLIEDSHLKGKTIGGAMVSPKHAGFIINYDHATSSDLIALIKYVQDVVRENFGVDLQTEVKIIGRDKQQ